MVRESDGRKVSLRIGCQGAHRSTAAVIIAVVHARLCAGDRMERFDERWGGGGAAGSRHWMKIDGSGGGSDGPG